MSTVLKNIFIACILACSASAFADKVTIIGKPVTLTKENCIYVVPHEHTFTTRYYYVTYDGTKRVCYLEKHPTLAADVSSIRVRVNGMTHDWYCYDADTRYFIIKN